MTSSKDDGRQALLSGKKVIKSQFIKHRGQVLEIEHTDRRKPEQTLL